MKAPTTSELAEALRDVVRVCDDSDALVFDDDLELVEMARAVLANYDRSVE